jgi:hypothetical protein
MAETASKYEDLFNSHLAEIDELDCGARARMIH